MTSTSICTSGSPVRELRTLHELEAFADAWRELWERCPEASVFQRPEWLIAWCRHLLLGEPRALIVTRSDAVAGFLPLFVWRDGSARVLSMMGAGVSDYGDVLAPPGERIFVRAALEDWLATHAWDRLELSELPSDSLLLDMHARNFGAAYVTAGEVCPGLSLKSARSLEEALPPKIMARVAYARRRAEREGGLRTEVATEQTWRASFESLAALHGARWRGRGGGALGTARLHAFHREVCRELVGGGGLILTQLFLRNRVAAAFYGFHDRSATRYYLSGFDPNRSRSSPGMLVVADAIERALELGSTLFDFLRGAEPYKYTWGATDRARLSSRRVQRHE